MSYFTNDTEAVDKEIEIELAEGNATYKIILLDETHDAECVGELVLDGKKASLTISPNTVVYLEQA
jgi:hypothetical protein